MTPSRQTNTTPVAPEPADEDCALSVPQLTEVEAQRALEALDQARAFQRRLLAAHGGEPLPESWPLIREAREER